MFCSQTDLLIMTSHESQRASHKIAVCLVLQTLTLIGGVCSMMYERRVYTV